MASWTGFPQRGPATTGGNSQRSLPPPITAIEGPRLPFTAILTVEDAEGFRASHPFTHPRMVLGRTEDNDLRLDDPNVSTRHCELVSEGGWLIVRDLGSANGTYVNERRISEARVKHRDVVRVGKTRIFVALSERRGARLLARYRWLWAALGLLLLVGAGFVVWRRELHAAAVEARLRYEALVKDDVQRDLCARGAPPFDELRAVDGELAGKSVALEMRGSRFQATPQGRETNTELLALWRKKQAIQARAAAAVVEKQQTGRETQERISRSGARLGSPKDRKIAFWIDGLLAERLTASDRLAMALRELEKQTERFAGLIERYTLRGDQGAARELTTFQFGRDAAELTSRCDAEMQRLASGVLSALNGLDEE